MLSPSFVLIVVVGVLGFFVVTLYNRLVKLRQGVRQSWANIDTELRRRADLIPNLVETVKGYASHEKETLENVIRARNAAIAPASSVGQAAQNETALSGALRQIFALSESYPELKADANFRQLQEELSQTETRLAASRQSYNSRVGHYNTAIETVPSSLIANSFGFKPEAFFEIEDPAVRDAPVVRF
ncbi:MAG TPA: LemA family protein [Abditibacteriaceae bacterium]|jgi:LemA protein